jgi:hypothetical protein
MKRTIWLAWILIAGVIGFSPVLFQSNSAQADSIHPQLQPTPTPQPLPYQVLVDASVALDKCFEGYISSAWCPRINP